MLGQVCDQDGSVSIGWASWERRRLAGSLQRWLPEKQRNPMEQRQIIEKASAFGNMCRRDAGAPRTERNCTCKDHRYIFQISLTRMPEGRKSSPLPRSIPGYP
jgi:hypothetical protein